MNLLHRIILPAAALSLTAVCANALTVNVQPGGLRQAVVAVSDPAAETVLVVTGSVDASDFDFIREMKSLRTLDLSGATVAAYSGAKTASGITFSDAGVLPCGALMSCPSTTLALPSGITEIGLGALGDSKSETVVIPASVTTIADGAFSGMDNLQEITVPATVTSMGEMVFKDCTALRKAVIDASVDILPATTFQNCTSLSSVSLPANLTAIGSSAFAGCVSLGEVSLPASLREIGDLAFAGSGLTSVALNGVTTVGDWAFVGCASLTEINTGSSLTSLGKGVFFNDPQLTASIGAVVGSMTRIPDYLFYGASSVSVEDFPQTSVEEVGAYALSGNASTSVTLPQSLSSLGDHAMERWENLAQVDVVAIGEVPALGESVWEGVNQPETVLFVPSELLMAYKDAPQWREFDVKVPFSGAITIPVENPAGLRAGFDGMSLMIEAGQDILAVQLYDIAGRCVTISRNSQGNRMTVDTAPFDTRVFIVRILLADGSTPVLKLAR